MKRLFTFVAAVVAALSSFGQIGNRTTIPGDFWNVDDFIISQFTNSGKTYLVDVSHDNNDECDVVKIYDENFNVARTFKVVEKEDEYVDRLYFVNIDAATCEDNMKVYYTQNLFNDDEKIEYIAFYGKKTETSDEWGTYYDFEQEGIRIYSEDGTVLQTVSFPENIDGDIELMLLNGTYYLVLSASDQTLFYPIIKDGGNNSIGAPKKINSKLLCKQYGKKLTVAVDEVSNTDRDLIIVDASGKLGAKVVIPAGQNEISVNTSRLNLGVNIVSVKEGMNIVNNCKIIVK